LKTSTGGQKGSSLNFKWKFIVPYLQPEVKRSPKKFAGKIPTFIGFIGLISG